ncbi:Glycosyltransferase Family 1 protein [Gigaspora rosea]|uniref:Glycosyltransferase Family 1 protein n=1 Tax=Gigaspora rosea TaxID=44941 RepID=A0A397VNN6_9GLOM|nr:Glycosyltransferase Family 1 protein [Gigaspora rosea]
MEICKILMDRGYNVTLAAPENFTAQSISYSLIPQVIIDRKIMSSIDLKRLSKERVYTDDDFKRNYLKQTIYLAKGMINTVYVPLYNVYKEIVEDINPDLFLCDYYLNHPCFDLAWKLGKPVVGITSTISYFLIVSPPPYKSDPMLGCPVNMENESFYNRFRCALISPLQFIWSANENLVDLNVQRAKVGVEPHWNPRGRISNILMLFDSFLGFEISSVESPLHQEIGPIMSDIYPGLTPVLDSFLVTHPRTIYFAIGTYAVLSDQIVAAILKSFLKLIDQDVIDGVIWATMNADTSKLMSLSDTDISMSVILNNNYSHIHVTKRAPQFAILSHENTKLFLSHGGVSSSHEALYNAKPMLILPIFGDQLGNAQKLELAGVALRISEFNLNVNDIILKVKRLLNEENFKGNAKRLQFLAKINSKRKYRGADLIEVVMNTAKHEGFKNESGVPKVDNEKLLKDWITPDTRMGYVRGNYLDVYGAAIILVLTTSSGLSYILLMITRYFYAKWLGNMNSQEFSRPKRE